MGEGSEIAFTVSFGGGAEQLFENQRLLKLSLPDSIDGRPLDIRYLIAYLAKRIKDPKRVELFAQGETVRPGILILVNDVDWELEGELDYAIQPRDDILFISTLHGG